MINMTYAIVASKVFASTVNTNIFAASGQDFD